MKTLIRRSYTAAALIVLAATFMAQQSVSAQTGNTVPLWFQFSGVLKDVPKEPGIVGLSFALYREQQGGAPLWIETQNVTVDEQGRYTALLGSAGPDGLPLEFFSSGEARWLGIIPAGRDGAELPRVLLVSVPYALEAANAATLGGRPASSFLLKESTDAAESTKSLKSADGEALNLAGTGTVGKVAKFTTVDTVGDSIMTESSGRIGIGTANPATTLDVNGSVLVNSYIGMRGPLMNFRPYSGDLLWSWTSGMVFDTAAAGRGIAFNTNNTTKLWVDDATGRITIGNGVTTGGSKLGVNGNMSLGAAFVGAAAPANGLLIEGNVGIGTTAPTQKLDVAGTVKVGGSGIVFPDASILSSATAARTRSITYLAGCETCSVLTDADDQPMIFQNVIGNMTVLSVACYSDAGNPSFNLNVLGAGILNSGSCSTSGGSISINPANTALSPGQSIDFVMVNAGASTHRLTVIVKAIVN